MLPRKLKLWGAIKLCRDSISNCILHIVRACIDGSLKLGNVICSLGSNLVCKVNLKADKGHRNYKIYLVIDECGVLIYLTSSALPGSSQGLSSGIRVK